MDGIHDMGGMHGFGPVPYRRDDEPEELFPERWQSRVFGMAGLAMAAGLANVDAFRHAIERVDPVRYLEHGYYGRWLRGLEILAFDASLTDGNDWALRLERKARSEDSHATESAGEAAERIRPARSETTVLREVDAPPRFGIGDRVRARRIHPGGHTRLPRYARGRVGEVAYVYPACVFPDTNAHGLGESPQYVYAVLFEGEELWGESSEPGVRVSLDLFESYLEPAARDQRA